MTSLTHADAPCGDAALLEERAEWIESVDGLIAARGINPAGRLLDDVAAHARTRGVALTGRTPYRNTIPVQGQPLYPGDEALEARISAYLRWNAMAMVVRANKRHQGLGGHLSTYASTLTLWEVGFHHFFRGRGPTDEAVVPGDQVFFQGHASPGIYARAFLEGRLTAEQLDLFRREIAGQGGGLPSYPHPRSMGEFWEFPTVSLGIGPLHAVCQARFNRYLAARGLADTTAAHVWCFVGDGESDEPDQRTDALLLVKAAVPAVVAWQLSVRLMHSPTPFYAPLAALLVVDKTIVRSIWQSVERVVAVVVGMSVAWAVGTYVGVTWWSMVLVMLLALLIGRWDRFGDHGIQVPVMVLLSLLTAKWDNVDFTHLTILATVLGGAVGVLVNAVVLAPMHLTEPRGAVLELTERVRGLLEDLAEGLREGWDGDLAREWHSRSTRIGEVVPEVLEAIQTGRESTGLNPRHRLRPVRIDWDGYARTAEAVQRTQWPVAGIARTLADAADGAQWQPSPSPRWLDRYADVLDHLGAAGARFAVHREDAEREVEEHLDAAVRALDVFGEQVGRTNLQDSNAWPAYGALVLEARRLVGEVRGHSAEASVPTDAQPRAAADAQ